MENPMKKYSDLKAAIVGRSQFTANYEAALRSFRVNTQTVLSTGELQTYDLLILPGGGDITPAFFGQKNKGSGNIDTELDILQIQALDLFVRLKKPVLGICKGMQLINVFFGGNIRQHLPTASSHAYRDQDQYHSTHALPGSTLHRLYGECFTVNSAHHQGIDVPGRQLEITQTAPDGVAEGIEHSALPILGVQWHPERLMKRAPSGAQTKKDAVNGSLLFQEFLSRAL